MLLPMCTVDSFTAEPFGGNPAGVCLLQDDIPDCLKQKVAAEMNISETAFVTRRAAGSFESGDSFGLRWFTPTNEVPLCGHATLAAAKVLFTLSQNVNKTINFQTLSGVLKVSKDKDRIVMDLPLNRPASVPLEEFKELIKELIICERGLEMGNQNAGKFVKVCGDLAVLEAGLCGVTKKLMVRLADTVTRTQLQGLTPNTERMMKLDSSGRVKGVIVTMKGDQNPYHFLSRYFAPWNGIPEDPVTGSAHTVLAPYWSDCLATPTLLARQCSPRGGDLHLTLSKSRLLVKGEAVIVLQGTISC